MILESHASTTPASYEHKHGTDAAHREVQETNKMT